MNIVLFSMKNENTNDSVTIEGVQILVKDLRNKIKDRLRIQSNDGQNNEELQLYDDQDGILTIGDKVRSNSKVFVVRLPKQNSQSHCRSCWLNKSSTSTTCCRQPICQNCDQRFTQSSKCPFTLNPQCSSNHSHNNTIAPVITKSEISVNELSLVIQSALFYIVKSNNDTNVNIAKQHNIWATTMKNFKKLTQAFNQNRNVLIQPFKPQLILIFTANRAEKFLGCARMINTYVNVRNMWQGTGQVTLADSFGIEWLRKGSIDFNRVADITNPLSGESITRSRDCQEVPQDIGRTICLEFEQIKYDEAAQTLQQAQHQQALNSNRTTNIQSMKEETPAPPLITNNNLPVSSENSVNMKEEIQWDFDQILQPKDQKSKDEAQSPSKSKSAEENDEAKQQQMLSQLALNNPAMIPMLMAQQMHQQMQMQMDTWNQLNKGKIPGLTGKIKYQHPYFAQLMQYQHNCLNQYQEQVKQLKDKKKNDDSSDRDRKSKKEKHSKSRKDKKEESIRGSSSDRSRSKRDDKKKKHKQKKKDDRSRDRSKKNRKN